MRNYLIILMLGIFSMSSYAQTQDDPWWVNIELTNNKFSYRFWEGLYDFGQLDNAGFRVGVDRYISKSFDAEFGFSHGKLQYENIFKSSLTDIDLRLIYKLTNGYIFKEDSKISPFVFAGLGLNWFNNIEGFFEQFEEGTHATIPMGAGVEFKVTEGASITTKAAFNNSVQDAPSYMQYSLGVSFSLGRKKDSDGDGIYDKEDACPNQAGPAENKGCPWPDSDGDGVLDKDDACPTEAGTLNGCPDTDGDGIKDSEDKCPTVAGVAAFGGCPDTDGDGVQDSEDECPNVAGTLNGCPDNDGDGVKNSDDRCPNVAGTLNGCPDADGDGIRDQDDTCPQVAGIAANKGCPEVKEEVKKALELAVKNIQFNSGSDVLKTSSYASLNQVAELMKEDTSFNLELSGYTDNTGRVESNLELSKRRANAVKAYLEGQSIAANRLSADGYGIANPVADNATREGRAANRRVELKIVFE
ncbi:thrombospondin type 3 repeat-containing protein [Roseivirga sp.]|uniref:thrombospondin type 3 repeat-containing protein n=1 Tax=Roseivirga sp. TaxID=1964215 RepID=UPI003B8AD0E7